MRTGSFCSRQQVFPWCFGEKIKKDGHHPVTCFHITSPSFLHQFKNTQPATSWVKWLTYSNHISYHIKPHLLMWGSSEIWKVRSVFWGKNNILNVVSLPIDVYGKKKYFPSREEHGRCKISLKAWLSSWRLGLIFLTLNLICSAATHNVPLDQCFCVFFSGLMEPDRRISSMNQLLIFAWK